MNTTKQDTIERELTFSAPIERVYRALADPSEISKWFPEAVEGELKPGESPVFDFGKYGKVSVYVVAAEPNAYFAYRWRPGGGSDVGDVLSGPNTLVEFKLEAVAGGTKLQMVESGFASLPEEMYAQALEDNTGGWDSELTALAEYLKAA
jgi:uncharacterized protein YndB with AHSA1/START domain